MTPTCTRLRARLDERRRWFANEWFFKWHFIGKDGPVSIDSFDGRGIHLGGIEFSGSARDVFWDAVVRGVNKEINEQFACVDVEVRNYNHTTALKSIDECAGQLISFVKSIRREAISKDRILRGDGINFPSENGAGWWDETSDAVISAQAAALKAGLPIAIVSAAPKAIVTKQTLRQRATSVWNANQWWIGPIAVIATLAGLWVSIR